MEDLVRGADEIDKWLERDREILLDEFSCSNVQYITSSSMGVSMIGKALSTPEISPSRSLTAGSKHYPDLVLQRRMALPGSVIQQLSQVQFTCMMGVFQEIHRAWFVMDNRLYLWNYKSSTEEVVAVEVFEEPILAVSLVPAKPAVFMDDIKYLLLVSTPNKVSLLGVSLYVASSAASANGGEDKGLAGVAANDFDISIVRTNLQAYTERIQMIKIVGTESGRIFLAASDGGLYELVYSLGMSRVFDLQRLMTSNKRGSQYTCDLRNNSQGYIQGWLPKGIRAALSSPDPLVDILILPNTKVLLTLSASGMLRLYNHDGVSGSAPKLLQEISVDRVLHRQGSKQSATFIALGCTLISLAYSDHLVAVITSRGERVVYRLMDAALIFMSYRPIPPKASNAMYSSLQGFMWDKDSFIFVESGDDMVDSIVTCFPWNRHSDRGGTRKGTPAVVQEIVSELALDQNFYGLTRDHPIAKAWCLVTVTSSETDKYDSFLGNALSSQGTRAPTSTMTPGGSTLSFAPPTAGSQELLQMRKNKKEVILLTNAGMYVYGVNRPADTLKKILSNGATSDMEALVEHRGPREVCSIAFSLLTELGSGSKAFNQLSFEQDVERIFTEYGSVWASDATNPHSSAYSAVLGELATLLSGIWSRRVTHSSKGDSFQRINLALSEIIALRDELETIQSVVIRLGFFKDGDQRSSDGLEFAGGGTIQQLLFDHIHRKQKAEEFQQQEARLGKVILVLIQRCIEALWLLIVFVEQVFHRLVAGLSTERRDALGILQFRELVAGENGAGLAAALIDHLLKTYADDKEKSSVLSRTLSEHCPGYFGRSDVSFYAAMGMLRQVSSGKAQGRDITDLLLRVVAEFKGIAGRIPDIFAVCRELNRLGSPLGAIEVAGTALLEAYERNDLGAVKKCDACILEMLESVFSLGMSDAPVRERAVQASLSFITPSDALNSVYVEQVFSLLIRLGDSGVEELLRLKHPMVEQYLDANNLPLLWKYYVREGRYLDACATLVFIADDNTTSLSLEDRIVCLLKGQEFAKRACSEGASRGAATLKSVEERLEVARLQSRVKEELQRKWTRHASIQSGGHAAQKASVALSELGTRSVDLTTLFNQYAMEFELWESQLFILRFADYTDESMVRNLWKIVLMNGDVPREGLDSAAGSSSAPPKEDVYATPQTIANRLARVGSELRNYPSVFPTSFILDLVEQQSFAMKRDASKRDSPIVKAWQDVPLDWVAQTFLKIEVSSSDVLNVYRALIEPGTTPSFWNTEHAQLHLITVVRDVISKIDPITSHVPSDYRAFALRLMAVCKSRLRAISSSKAAELLAAFAILESRIS